MVMDNVPDIDLAKIPSSENSYNAAYSGFLKNDLSIVNKETHLSLTESESYTGLSHACLVGVGEARDVEIDLYNSGATRHMSGYLHRFINFIKIYPVHITAADKHTFQASGKGDIYIHIPNGDKPKSQILLKDVLYALSMGVTLVLISKIASAGSMVVFSGNFCQIFTKKAVVGEIPVNGRLYHVYHPANNIGGYAATTKESLTINELHCQLGHVSHERAKFLVKKGLVEAIELNAGDEVTVCESCESAKVERKSITKV